MEYTIKDFRIGDFKDQNGNTWCQATFEEHGEPVIWVVKDPSKVVLGTKVRGEIKDWTSAKGKTSARFYKEQAQQSFTPAEDKPYKKDPSLVPVQLYNGSLNYAKDAGLNLIDNLEDRRKYIEYVREVTEEMLIWIDNIRDTNKLSGSNTGSLPASAIKVEAHPPAAPIKQKLANSHWADNLPEEEEME